jgi:hypothetical protein
MDEKLLSLPWQIQLALGSGYAAYIVAYVGIRDHHRGVDIAFRAIAFGLIATAFLAFTPALNLTLRLAGAVLITVAAGLVWRRFGMGAAKWLLRQGNISWSDDTPSAWATIIAAHRPVTQISVLLDNGTWLNCSAAGRFNDAPFGPCIFGPNGDIGFYVTDEESVDGTVIVNDHVRDAIEGDRLTYVPAARIVRMSIRHVMKLSRDSTAAEEGVSQPEE